MYRYKSLLVCLRDDAQDDRLIAYADTLAHLAQSGRVQFLHVVPEIPPLADLYPDVLPFLHAATAAHHSALCERVTAQFDGPWHTSVHCEITDGVPSREILRVAQEGAFDLLVVGQSVLAEQVLRKAPCSVLVVPEGIPAHIERIVVPVDFSAHAAEAVDVAAAFAEAAGADTIHLLHAYAPPPTPRLLRPRTPGGLTATTRAEALRWASQRFAAFLDRLNLRGLAVETHLVETAHVQETILEETAALGADLVIVGTRGRNPSAAVQLGTVAEAVLRRAAMPIVAVKRKNAATHLLDRLLAQHIARAPRRFRFPKPA